MKKIIIIPFLLLFATLLSFGQSDAAAGKSIFNNRCASCHSFKQEMTGPVLKDVDKRRKPEWIIKFVQSSQTVISSGDADAKAVFAKYQTVMPDHKDLQDNDVLNIVAFIKEESARVAKEAENNPIKRPKETMTTDVPLVFSKDWWVFLVYGFFLVLLVYAMQLAINANDLKKKSE